MDTCEDVPRWTMVYVVSSIPIAHHHSANINAMWGSLILVSLKWSKLLLVFPCPRPEFIKVSTLSGGC
jgi:hypothetical protein